MQLKKILYEVLLEHKFHIIGIFISGIIIIISTSSIPYYIGLGFQEIKDYSSVKNIYPLVYLSIYYLLRSIFKIVRNHVSAILGTNIVMKLRLYVTRVFVKNYSRQNTCNNRNLYSLLTYDLDTLSSIISYRSFAFIEDLFILVLSFIKMAQISLVVFVSICPFLIGLFIISIIYGRNVNGIIYNIRKNISNISSVVFENIIAQKAIRTLNAQNSEVSKFNRYNTENLDLNKELNAANKRFVPQIEFLVFLCMLTSVILSSYLITLKKLDLSTIITFYGYMTLLTGTAGSLSSIILFYINSRQSIIRMTETLKGYKDESNEEKMAYCETIDEIKLENVSFGYTNKRILNEISLTLQKGNITTITGEISCGKTTLVDIIAGLNMRYSGIIKVDHVDLKTIDINSYRTNIGYATQDPIFIHGTILENIILGMEGFTDEQLLNTLNISAVSEIIEKMEMKLNSIINKDVNFLSGGEKQRICIARALASNPQMIIIDDSITAIDSSNQERILDYLKSIKKDKIVVFVSNFKNIIDVSDRVYELHEGSLKIVN